MIGIITVSIKFFITLLGGFAASQKDIKGEIFWIFPRENPKNLTLNIPLFSSEAALGGTVRKV